MSAAAVAAAMAIIRSRAVKCHKIGDKGTACGYAGPGEFSTQWRHVTCNKCLARK